MMKDWQKGFNPSALKRGAILWTSGNLKNLRRRGDTVLAEVQDGTPYKVRVALKDGTADTWTCTCGRHTASSGCEHEAAMLYQMEVADVSQLPEVFGQSDPDPDHPKSRWEEALDQISSDALRNLLHSLAVEYPSVQETLLMLRNGSVPFDIQERISKNIDDILRRFDPTEYPSLYEVSDGLKRLLHNETEKMLRAQCPMEAFRMVYGLLLKISLLDYDSRYEDTQELRHQRVKENPDAYGMTGSERYIPEPKGSIAEVKEQCAEMMHHLARMTVPEDQREIFQKLKGIAPDLRKYAARTLFDSFWEPCLLRDSLQVMDQWLDEAETSGIEDIPTFRDTLLRRRIEILTCLGATPEEMWDSLEKYSDTPAVRQWEADEALSAGDREKALDLLRASRDMDSESPELTLLYTRQLVKLYEEIGDRESEQQELEYLVLNIMTPEFELVRKLKELTPEDRWHDLFEQILKAPGWKFHTSRLLELDGQYERLFEEVKKSGKLELLNEFRGSLIKWNRDKVITLYVELLNRDLDNATGRQNYEEIVGNLRYLRECSEYEARKLAGVWRWKFPRRKALLEVLDEEGF